MPRLCLNTFFTTLLLECIKYFTNLYWTRREWLFLDLLDYNYCLRQLNNSLQRYATLIILASTQVKDIDGGEQRTRLHHKQSWFVKVLKHPSWCLLRTQSSDVSLVIGTLQKDWHRFRVTTQMYEVLVRSQSELVDTLEHYCSKVLYFSCLQYQWLIWSSFHVLITVQAWWGSSEGEMDGWSNDLCNYGAVYARVLLSKIWK